MAKEIRVLQYVRVLDNGGIESLIFSLLDKTDRTKINYDFLLTRNREESYEDKITEYGCRKIVVEMVQKGFIPVRLYHNYKAAYCYFTKCEYPIVHFQSVGTSFGGSVVILAAKKAGIPVRIVHAHSNFSKVNVIKRLDNALGRLCHRQWGTDFMACSKSAAEFSFGKSHVEKIEVTYLKNGIDAAKFAFNYETRGNVRTEFGLHGKFVLGTIGRLSPQKNHFFMIDVLEETLKIRQDGVLLIVGGMSATHEKYAEELHEYVKMKNIEDKVIFTGERQDACRILNGIDAYLFSSLWEGLGIAAVEAQANGLQVFASSVVPRETQLTDNIHYLSLKDGPAYWSNYLTRFSYSDKRSSRVDEIKAAGYDIFSSARDLENYYLAKAKRI